MSSKYADARSACEVIAKGLGIRWRGNQREGTCSLAPSAGPAILDAAKGSKQLNCAEQRDATRQSFW